MHILQGVLALLLLPAAAFAAAPFDRMPGEWGGTVSADDGCVWKIRASVKAAGSGSAGTFSYDGDCADQPRQGKFTTKLTSPSCFSAVVNIGGMPPIPMTGCADKAGKINFKSVGFSGAIKFAKSGNAYSLSVKADRGSATGQFKRMVKKKRGGAKNRNRPPAGGGDERNQNGGQDQGEGQNQGGGRNSGGQNNGDDQKAAPEVLIGGY